jgi:nitric oxide dioxygenase
MITQQQKDLVRSTVPILKEHGLTLTKHFYNRMFTHNPELKNVFNMGNQQSSKQETALAMAVLAYAEHIENPAVLMPLVDGIGHKHTSLGIRPEQYQIVGKHLISSISEVLGESATPELLEAWKVAYFQLAAIMSGHEAGIYEQAVKKGGWTGWRPFIVGKKTIESTEITSFYLYPADGGSVADFLPGQFISVKLFLPELNLHQPRQYSLSNAPNSSYYRISVKREFANNGNPDGLVSNYLHDFIDSNHVIDVSAPSGSFTLQQNGRPVVFISGGIGQTPLLCMMQSLIETDSMRAITWIHGCRNTEVHAFKTVVDQWASTHPINQHIFYDNLSESQARKGIYKGWVDLKRIDTDTLSKDAQYYICGPAPFIKKHVTDLVNMGISRESIFFEEFGPQTLLIN